MTYSAMDVAKYVISYCHKNNRQISNLKLQKILYYVWIDYYKQTQSELYLDDICAWQLGPVVTSVYYDFCTYAGMPIPNDYNITLNQLDESIINPILDKYICVAASTLVDRTHRRGMPWDLVFQNGLGNRDVIPFSLIKEKECVN